MKTIWRIINLIACLSVYYNLDAQDMPARPSRITSGQLIGISIPLRDIPALTEKEYSLMKQDAAKRSMNSTWTSPVLPDEAGALPVGSDQARQATAVTVQANSLATLLNIEGQASPYNPSDCNGAAGPGHFMQTVNCSYAIYDKAGTLLAGPTDMNLLFGSVPGASCNSGDPVVVYDEQAGRWLAAELSICGTDHRHILMAVSTSGDPCGTWYQYSFDMPYLLDYEKIAVWNDGYYMGINNPTNEDIFVMERSQMLVGGPARMVAFDNPNRPGILYSVVVTPPVNNAGTFAPAGSPGTFIGFNDDATGGGSDQLWIYELAVDWVTPANSTFRRTQQLDVIPFDSRFSNNQNSIAQPGTTIKLDAISTVIMNIPQYRNFGSYQSIVCCHTVDVDGTDHAGVRWYELRKTPPSTVWTVRQQGTYAPDEHSRWMGTVAMNGSNRIAVGYSISSSTEYPGIRYACQSSAAFANASGVLDFPEVNAYSGTYNQISLSRWGDYCSMSVDPSNDLTFWLTTQYVGPYSTRKTRIISFNIEETTTKSLTLTSVFPEGLYQGNGMLKQVNDETGVHWPAGIADHITVELHDASNYNTVSYIAPDVALSTTGATTLAIPEIFNGSYYITIKHRNSLETTTAVPVSFAGSAIVKSFATPADVFGGNLIKMPDSNYCIYGGDVNRDGIIDLSDLIPVGNQAAVANAGYLPEDVNGDGLIDLSDLIIVGNSAALAIGVILP
jgi:hypothetical protein